MIEQFDPHIMKMLEIIAPHLDYIGQMLKGIVVFLFCQCAIAIISEMRR